MSSKLLKKGANKRISTVDRNVGVVSRHGLSLVDSTAEYVAGIFRVTA